MPNIITYNYFKGTLNLPHTGSGQGQVFITQYITQFEIEFLRLALGYELAKELVANIASTDDKWKDLRDGVEYQNSRLMLDRWNGFKDETNWISPIANYVFYKIVDKGIVELSGVGAIQPEAENAQRLYPQLMLVDTWNRMVDMVRILHDFLRLNRDTYPEFNYYTPTTVAKKINEFGI